MPIVALDDSEFQTVLKSSVPYGRAQNVDFMKLDNSCKTIDTIVTFRSNSISGSIFRLAIHVFLLKKKK